LGSGGVGFLRRLRKGKNKVLKKKGIPVDWIIGGYSGDIGVNMNAHAFTLLHGDSERSDNWDIPVIGHAKCL